MTSSSYCSASVKDNILMYVTVSNNNSIVFTCVPIEDPLAVLNDFCSFRLSQFLLFLGKML